MIRTCEDDDQLGQSSEIALQSQDSLHEEIRKDESKNKSCLSSGREDAIAFTSTISIVSLSLFLLQLILRENGFSSGDLQPLVNLSWLWLVSLLGGYVVTLIHLPPLLGMLSAGIIISNASPASVIPETWGTCFTSAGLAIILLRSGLELDLASVQKSSLLTIRLTCIPGCVEALVCGLTSMLFFGMPFWLGLSHGFILAAVSPAVVVGGMLNLQSLGYGVAKGIPSLVVAAASFDDVFAIAGFSMAIGLAIQGEDTSLLHSALHGPVSVAIGIIAGIGSGMTMSA